jgi:hypothetical protein
VSQQKCTIYLIDNEDQRSTALALNEYPDVEARWLYPTEVTSRHLEVATLLAVDQYFDLYTDAPDEDFELPPNLPPAVVPVDGLALASVLRSAAKGGRRTSPIGIALRSAELDKLTADLPQGIRQPLVAAQHDLEWVVPKVSDIVDPAGQLVSLARALATYPSEWPSGRVRDVGIQWLGVPSADWAGLAREQIGQCRPPVEVADTSAHGLSWLRWLAHRVLPFPTFLLQDTYVAAMLGVTPDSLRLTLAGGSELGRQLRACRYTGALADLQPPRYWRAGIHHLINSYVGDEDTDDPFAVAETIVDASSELVPLRMVEPVVCIDADYRPSDQIVERDSAKRLAPDGWPAYADPAWGDPGHLDAVSLQRLSAPTAG